MKLISGIIIILLLSANILDAGTRISREINSGWKFHEAGTSEWLKATVPGCVHTDLLDNKKIEDPFYRMNEARVQWVGKKDWEYETTFSTDNSILQRDRVEIVFQGIDTYADVYINDQLVLSTDNMHRTWRVDVKSILRPGDNKLRVYIYSVFKKAMPLMQSAPFPLWQFPNNDQSDTTVSIYVRKAGYHFGWDWGPRLVTAGIWRPVTIEAWDEAKFDGVQVITKSILHNKASMAASMDIIVLKSTTAEVSVSEGSRVIVKKSVQLNPGNNKISLDFDIINPKLWWSNGLGKADLYTFDCRLVTASKSTDRQSVTTGIRTLKVITDNDKYGKSMYILLNGVPVFMKGANLIPFDNFTNRVSDESYEYIIKSAAEAHMNMLRLWGGGYFEKDILYNLCDKYGILIWHDMLFACGTYPFYEAYNNSVTEEIKDNVRRIRNHPSIALWNGNNEVEVAYYQWGTKEKLTREQQAIEETNIRKFFYDIVPKAIFSVDTTRSYHPTSPNTGYNNIPQEMGDVHYWSVWHGKQPFESYNTNIGRFMSEYGFQSYPELATIKAFTLPEDRTLESPVMKSHQRCMSENRRDIGYGNRLIKFYMDQYFKPPKNFNDYIYVSQLLQAKGVKMAIEAHRRNMPECMGTLFWQINDCWPVASWSSIDYYGRWKALQYAARDLYKEQLVSTVIEDGVLKTFVVSDRLSAINATLKFTMLDFMGKTIREKDTAVVVPANTSTLLYRTVVEKLLEGHDKSNCFLNIRLMENNKVLAINNFFFAPEKELALTKPDFKISIKQSGKKSIITLNASTLSKDVYLSVPDVDGFYSDNYFDLIPGETKEVTFDSKTEAKDILNHLSVVSLYDSY